MKEKIKEAFKVETGNRGKPFNLHQLQIDGLKEGWLIYPQTLKPLTLTIRKKKKTLNH